MQGSCSCRGTGTGGPTPYEGRCVSIRTHMHRCRCRDECTCVDVSWTFTQICTRTAQELVGRAAAQGFAPALTAHALWILQRGAEAEKEKETRRIQAAVQQHQEQEERQPWPPPPPGSTDSYLPVLEEKQEEEEEAHVSLKSTADLAPTYVKKAESLLRRAVDAAGELGCPEAHAALATLAGWGRMGLGLQLQLGTGGEEKEGGREEERVREIAGRLAAAASGGHARARVGLAAAFWDPMVAFDVSSSDKGGINSTTTSTRTLVVQGSGFGREPIVQIPSLRCSCPLALGLARPAAEMALSGVVEQALRAYDGGDDGVARRLYALAAEAGLLSAQVCGGACCCTCMYACMYA